MNKKMMLIAGLIAASSFHDLDARTEVKINEVKVTVHNSSNSEVAIVSTLSAKRQESIHASRFVHPQQTTAHVIYRKTPNSELTIRLDKDFELSVFAKNGYKNIAPAGNNLTINIDATGNISFQ